MQSPLALRNNSGVRILVDFPRSVAQRPPPGCMKNDDTFTSRRATGGLGHWDLPAACDSRGSDQTKFGTSARIVQRATGVDNCGLVRGALLGVTPRQRGPVETHSFGQSARRGEGHDRFTRIPRAHSQSLPVTRRTENGAPGKDLERLSHFNRRKPSNVFYVARLRGHSFLKYRRASAFSPAAFSLENRDAVRKPGSLH